MYALATPPMKLNGFARRACSLYVIHAPAPDATTGQKITGGAHSRFRLALAFLLHGFPAERSGVRCVVRFSL